MFTGIVQSVGRLELLERFQGDVRLTINLSGLNASLKVGESIAVNGVCLTVSRKTNNGFIADVSTETLSLTTLGVLNENTPVNLEPALTTSTRLGGHLISGHVDGIGEIRKIENDARSVRFEFLVPAPLSRYMADKGSVAIDGVSLTINSVVENQIAINILPHTLENTIFSDYTLGGQVNVEVDMMARYLEKLAQSGSLGEGITWEGLRKHGFIKSDTKQ